MKTLRLFFVSAIAATTLLFTACQKESSLPEENEQGVTHSDDQNRFSEGMDGAVNDANAVMEATSGFTGKGEDLQTLICDATITVDTMSNPRTITITYNGTNCIGRFTRTGVVVISIAQGVRWRDAGAQVNLSFQNLVITRIIDNKSITINGTKTFTNVSGGLLINLALLGTITHTVSSNNMSVTFDDGSQRNWNIGRQRVYSYNNGIVITVTGTHSEAGVNGIAEWGTNRFGNSFTTAIVQPLVMRQDCSFRLGSGQVDHDANLFNASVTFGLNAQGNPTTCPGAAPYYMKIVWTGPAGNTRTRILPY